MLVIYFNSRHGGVGTVFASDSHHILLYRCASLRRRSSCTRSFWGVPQKLITLSSSIDCNSSSDLHTFNTQNCIYMTFFIRDLSIPYSPFCTINLYKCYRSDRNNKAPYRGGDASSSMGKHVHTVWIYLLDAEITRAINTGTWIIC